TNFPMGLAVDLPDMNFIEVIQFSRGQYDHWYDALTMGFHLTPTAATDYPCVKDLPGRERFYTLVERSRELSPEAWLDGVRRGRTFVTNGPAIDFRVADKGVGEEVVLREAGAVFIEARVLFDPSRDDVKLLEVVHNGKAVPGVTCESKAGEIRC